MRVVRVVRVVRGVPFGEEFGAERSFDYAQHLRLLAHIHRHSVTHTSRHIHNHNYNHNAMIIFLVVPCNAHKVGHVLPTKVDHYKQVLM